MLSLDHWRREEAAELGFEKLRRVEVLDWGTEEVRRLIMRALGAYLVHRRDGDENGQGVDVDLIWQLVDEGKMGVWIRETGSMSSSERKAGIL